MTGAIRSLTGYHPAPVRYRNKQTRGMHVGESENKVDGRFKSVAALFRHRVSATPNGEAFSYPDSDENWHTLNWRQVGDRVRAIACGLRALGIDDEERVAIVSTTRIEWVLADFGILCAGAATTTIYPSNTAEECAFIVTDSGTRIVFAEDNDQVAKLQEKRSELKDLLHVVTFDGSSSDDGFVLTLSDLEAKGREYDKAHPNGWDETIDRVTLDRLATLIYTSGTTGRPKGVELIHDCWVYTAEGIAALNLLRADDKQFLWLPLSHSFGKVLEVSVLHIGIPTAIDGRVPKIVDNLSAVRPTFVAAAPRIFEKVYNKVVTGAQEAGGLKYKIFRWAVGVGNDVARIKLQGGSPSGMLAFKYKWADKLVFSKLRAKFGGRLRFFISGSAPLSQEIAEFFYAANILILEGYGLTESSAATFVNRPDSFKFGTVGMPLPGTEVKIAESDGEILIKSRGIMRGYHNLAEVSAETLIDSWLHTGDIGELDAAGRLRITDRKKDLIKTSGGKYVAPQELEMKLKAKCPYIGQVLVHGDRRNFCSALVTIDEETIAGWAKDNGLEGKSYEALTQDPKIYQLVDDAVNLVNGTMASYATIKKFAILKQDFTVETGELTPSLKVKRKVVEERYKDVLDGFYQGAIKKAS